MRFTYHELIKGGYLALYAISLLTINALSEGRFETYGKRPANTPEQTAETVKSDGLPQGVTFSKPDAPARNGRPLALAKR